MRADILRDGILRLTPESVTEESMLDIWYEDPKYSKKQVSDVLMIDTYESIGPSCIKNIATVAGDVKEITGEAKKALRKQIKEELDLLNVEYEKRASTSVLSAILEKVKEHRGKTEKEPTKVEPPAPEPEKVKKGRGRPKKDKPKKETAPKTEVATVDITIDSVRKALKKYAATEGRTAAIKLLADHDAVDISSLKEESYVAFINAAQVE